MRRLIVTALVILTALTATLGARQADPRAAVEAANKHFMAAFGKGDAAALAMMYTTGALAFPPNGDITRGREAIQKLWAGALATGVKALSLITVEVEGHGDTAHEVGTYEMHDAAGKVVDRGKYVVIWKREQGQWKLHRDIWNTNIPPTK